MRSKSATVGERVLKVCADPTCPELVEKGNAYCARHRREDHRTEKDRQIKARSEWRWVYKSPRWQGLRAEVKAEQPFCDTAGCFELTHDIDHRVPVQDGGAPFDRANVHGMCKRHHTLKTQAEIRARRAGSGGRSPDASARGSRASS